MLIGYARVSTDKQNLIPVELDSVQMESMGIRVDSGRLAKALPGWQRSDDLPIHDNYSAKRLGTWIVQHLHRDFDRPRR